MLAQYDGVSGALQREYIWLGDKPIAVIDASKAVVAKNTYTGYGWRCQL